MSYSFRQLCIASLFILVVVLGGCEWRGVQVGGARPVNLYVGASDKNLYAFEVDRGKFLWKHALDGEVFSEPLVANDWVFVAATDGALYGISSDGKQFRKTQLVPVQTASQYQKVSVLSKPIMLGGTIFVASKYQGTIFAVSLFDGTLTNSHSLGIDTKESYSLTLGQDQKTIFANAEGIGISAFETLGQLKWTKPSVFVYGPLQQLNDGTLVGHNTGVERYFDPANGNEKSSPTDYRAFVSSLSIDRQNNIAYWSLSTGIVMRRLPGGWSVNPFRSNTWMNADVSLGLFLASLNGHVARIDPASGQIVWDKTLAPEEFWRPPLAARVNQNTSPSVFRLIVVSRQGHLYSYDGDGKLLQTDTTTIGGEVHHTPVAEIP